MLHSREQRAIHWGLVVVSAVSSVTAAKVKGEPSFLIVGAFVTAIFLLAASLRAPSLRQVIRIIDEQMKFSEFPCIGCGYELRGLPAADDGATVCPECGAAWHVPVITPSSAAPSPPSS